MLGMNIFLLTLSYLWYINPFAEDFWATFPVSFQLDSGFCFYGSIEVRNSRGPGLRFTRSLCETKSARLMSSCLFCCLVSISFLWFRLFLSICWLWFQWNLFFVSFRFLTPTFFIYIHIHVNAPVVISIIQRVLILTKENEGRKRNGQVLIQSTDLENSMFLLLKTIKNLT